MLWACSMCNQPSEWQNVCHGLNTGQKNSSWIFMYMRLSSIHVSFMLKSPGWVGEIGELKTVLKAVVKKYACYSVHDLINRQIWITGMCPWPNHCTSPLFRSTCIFYCNNFTFRMRRPFWFVSHQATSSLWPLRSLGLKFCQVNYFFWVEVCMFF